MRILIGYDGSTGANAALDDLQLAGLPCEAEAQVITVAEQCFSHSPLSRGSIKTALRKLGLNCIGRVTAQDSDTVGALEEAKTVALKASRRVQAKFPDWILTARWCDREGP